MAKILITYGDDAFEKTKQRLIKQAESIGVFDKIISYSPSSVSEQLRHTEVWKVKKGGGLWSWKPDVILRTMESAEEGDFIVYCDAGCSVYKSPEWDKIWKILDKYDMIAQRIFQRTAHWTRREIIDHYKEHNGRFWPKCYQYQATTIFKNTLMSRAFVKEWRDMIISEPKLVMDVSAEEYYRQYKGFIENRHDQAVYSALVYKYLSYVEYKGRIYTQWEHIEDYDPIHKQAIRATRLRCGGEESRKNRVIGAIKRLIKDYIYKPCYFSWKQKLYNYLNYK